MELSSQGSSGMLNHESLGVPAELDPGRWNSTEIFSNRGLGAVESQGLNTQDTKQRKWNKDVE